MSYRHHLNLFALHNESRSLGRVLFYLCYTLYCVLVALRYHLQVETIFRFENNFRPLTVVAPDALYVVQWSRLLLLLIPLPSLLQLQLLDHALLRWLAKIRAFAWRRGTLILPFNNVSYPSPVVLYSCAVMNTILVLPCISVRSHWSFQLFQECRPFHQIMLSTLFFGTAHVSEEPCLR